MAGRGVNFLDREVAATRIQKFLRMKKAQLRQCDDEEEEERVVHFPQATRLYKGHRNARTMVSCLFLKSLTRSCAIGS